MAPGPPVEAAVSADVDVFDVEDVGCAGEVFELAPSKLQTFVTQKEVAHSFVQGATIYVRRSATEPSIEEEVILPPRVISSTNSQTLGTALFKNLEEHIFKQRFPEWLVCISSFFATVILHLTADTAAANRRVANLVQLLILRVLTSCLVLFHSEPCNIHLLCRISTFLLTDLGISTPLYSLGKISYMRSHKNRMQAAVKVVSRQLVYRNEGLIPPARDLQFEESLIELIDVKSLRASVDCSTPGEDDPDGIDNVGELKQDMFINALRLLFAFLRTSVAGSRLVHFCDGCCKNAQHATKRPVLKSKCLSAVCSCYLVVPLVSCHFLFAMLWHLLLYVFVCCLFFMFFLLWW
jgi:hypothetical protein